MSPWAGILLLAAAQTAASETPWDRLSPESIPAERRFEGQPKELVAVLGKPEEYKGDGRHQIHGMGFSPDGAILATAAGQAVELWSLSDGALVPGGSFPAFVSRGWTWAFLPDGKTLAVTQKRGVQLWDVSGAPAAKKAELGTSGGPCLTVSADGRLLAAGGLGSAIGLWDLSATPPALAHRLEMEKSGVDRLAFSPDGKTLASGSFSRPLQLWDASTGRPRRVLKAGTAGHYWGLCFSPDGRTLIATVNAKGDQGKIRCWNLSGDEPKETVLKAGASNVRSVVFARQGAEMYSLGDDGEVLVWDTATWTARRLAKLPGAALDYHAMALAPDGRHLTVMDKSRMIYVFRLGS
jgi:WD40 repeat protein